MSLNPRRVATFGLAKKGALDKRRISTLGLWPFADALIPPSYLKKFTILLIDKTRSINLRG